MLNFLEDWWNICALFVKRGKASSVEDWRWRGQSMKTVTFLFTHSFSPRVGRRPKLEGTSYYVYTFNVTSMLLDSVLFINVSIEMYIMTINQIRTVQPLSPSTFWNYFKSWWKKYFLLFFAIVHLLIWPVFMARTGFWRMRVAFFFLSINWWYHFPKIHPDVSRQSSWARRLHISVCFCSICTKNWTLLTEQLEPPHGPAPSKNKVTRGREVCLAAEAY